jgi:hypothetical protein
VRLGRGLGPLGRLVRCGRGPFGRAHASCSSSVRRTVRCLFLNRRSTHDESMEVGPVPFTSEVALRSSLRIGYVFGQKRSQRVRLYHTNIQHRAKGSDKFNNIWKCGG